MDPSDKIRESVRRMAGAAAQISAAVEEVNDAAGGIAESDITPETRAQWELFVRALTDALAAAKSVLRLLPQAH